MCYFKAELSLVQNATIAMGSFRGQETVTEKEVTEGHSWREHSLLCDLLMHCHTEEAEMPNGFLDLEGHWILQKRKLL